MYSMQAVVRKSINNATMQFEKLGYVANNLANYNTAAYKTSRFEQILREDGYIDGAIRTNALQGSIRISKNPYDIAIEGEGYIPVVSEDGNGKIVQNAEIERSEIVLRLSLTQKLEKMLKQYNSDISQKEKDDIATKAGQILVDELLNKTIDNTNELL